MKPKLVWKDFFQSSGENATSRVLAVRLSDSWWPEGGLRVFLKISNTLYTLSPEKTTSSAAGDQRRETKLKTEARAPKG